MEEYSETIALFLCNVGYVSIIINEYSHYIVWHLQCITKPSEININVNF